MSRCFPFPPPGYEKKIRPDEADSLIKEKEKKEKKHKKEKKDKDKKEGKEKKDKETSKDKHKARKEKKEKHADRKDKDRDKEKSRSSEDKKGAGVLPNTVEREKPCKNNGYGESKFVQDLARRIRDEEEATHSQNVGKISFPCGVTENNISCPIPQTNNRKDDEKRINNTNRNFPAAKRSENEVRQLSYCTEQRGVEVMVKPVEKKDQAKIKELQEKNQRTYSVTKSDKPLYNEGIKKGEPMYITDRSSKEMKEEKTEVINKNGQEKPKFVEGGPRLKEREHDTVDIRNLRVPELSRGSVKNLTTEGIIGKRKDLETNGLSYENGSRPNKIQRPVVKNGRELGACQTPSEPVSVLLCNPEAKEHRNNGFIDSQEHKSHSPVSSVNVKENCEAPAKKRPHSDLKYLDKILNVPKREELHEVDDNEEQEWLFGQSGVQLLNKQQRRDSTVSLDETLQVWNQALRIESADIVALPYVVPF